MCTNDDNGSGIQLQSPYQRVAPERIRKPREDWAESLEEMHRNGDDRLDDWPEYPLTEWDLTEWEWDFDEDPDADSS
jgi:hypothetical protein